MAPHRDRNFAEKLQMAAQTLHDTDFVYGDLREPNILVTEDSGLKNIDFNWYGKDGEVCYPSDINVKRSVRWDPDVTKKNHDRSVFLRPTGLKKPGIDA